MVGWNKPLQWRANSVYAGLVAKIIFQHQNMLKATAHPPIPNYDLLSNDNAFLSYYPHQFTQRTLLARFQMNQTDPHYVTFIRKPVYSTMSLLSLLGETQVHATMTRDDGIPVTNISNVGCLASVHKPSPLTKNSSDSWQSTLLVFGASDPGEVKTSFNLSVNWTIPAIPGLKMMTYRLNNDLGNPFKVWAEEFNKTDFPSLEQFAKIRQQENPPGELVDIFPTQPGLASIPPAQLLQDPEIRLFHLCAKPRVPPEQVTGVRFLNVTAGQVLVIWSDQHIQTKCILTYEVELSTDSPQGPFHRVNQNDTIITAFVLETASDIQVQGFYRVRAVDYWKQQGEYSVTVKYHS